jgi:phosphoadenosine phosphosulfate reductase
VPVIFVDTLYHFDETLELADIARRRYDLDLRVYRAADSREDFEQMYGERLWEHDLEKFHDLTKVKPMQRALGGISGWITGRRRDQSSTRADLPLVEYNGRIKINPLVGWSREDVWAFIRDNEIPYNRLHDLGYTSIGDEPLTTPTLLSEKERAGRWRGQDRLECGLHTLY